MKKGLPILRYALILVLAWLLASLLEPAVLQVYKLIYPIEPVGTYSDLDLTEFGVFIDNFIFCFALLGILLGGVKRYTVVGIFLALSLVLSIFGDSSHILFWPIALVSGPVLGYVLRFAISKTLGKTPTFQSWKKYF